MNLNFNVGDVISIGEITYNVNGKITYADGSGETWDEYALLSSGHESWLSIDDETSVFIWQMTPKTNTDGMEQTDSDTERVVTCYGSVDVDPGDTARYTEYRNPQDDTYVSIEIWDDETEYSTGRRVLAENISLVSRNTTPPPPPRQKEKTDGKYAGKIGCAVIFLLVFSSVLSFCDDTSITIKEKIENNSDYPWETSITGYENKTADVYYTDYNSEEAAKNIIDLIEGELDYIQENPQDTLTIAILTKKELCLIYRDSSDNSTLVHLATREWTLDNLDAPLYNGDSLTNNFYKGFYQYYALADDTTGYSSESRRYRYYHHYYGTYFGTAYILHNSRYSSYSSSVREASAARRRSSGGGHGGGGK